MGRVITSFFAVTVSLATVTSFAQTRPSTPTDALKALIDAIDRDDVAAVGQLIELPLKLEKDELALFAQRYILGSKLFCLLEAKFGERDAQRVMRLARLDYVPRVDADLLKWETLEAGRPMKGQPVSETAIGSMRPGHGLVRMVRTQEGWKTNLNSGSAILVLDVQDAPWRNRVMQQVTDELKAGKLATIEQVIDGLVPRAPPQTEPVKADRSTPAGAIVAAAEAIEKGDAATFADSFEMSGGDDDGFLRRMAEQAVLEKKVENAIRARYPQDQAERIVKEGSLRRGLLNMYENVDGWVVEGDVARAALKERWYDVVRRMVRRDGIWRIQYPPRSTMASLNDPDERHRQEARMKALQEVLDHPGRFATAGALLDELNLSRKEMAQEVDVAAAARQQLEQIKQEIAKNPPRTPEEADEQELGLSLWELGVAVACKDAKEAAKHYFAEGDDGSYALARENRLLAAFELIVAVDKEIDSGAGSLLYEFKLSNLADDVYGLFMSELKIQGDRAVPTSGDLQGEWVPGIRKIAGEWKIDVTDETGGKPKDAAKRAEDEARKLAELTIQVRAGKFSNLDQLRKAIKDAGIRGCAIAG